MANPNALFLDSKVCCGCGHRLFNVAKPLYVNLGGRIFFPVCAPCQDAVKRRDLGISYAGRGYVDVYGTDGRGRSCYRRINTN